MELQTTTRSFESLDIGALLLEAERNPPLPMLEGLLNQGETAGIHGAAESFKTSFCLQLAQALITGEYFLGTWKSRQKYSFYFLETEMSVACLGRRVGRMFDGKEKGVYFASERQLKQFQRAGNLETKFALIAQWVDQCRPEVILIDTCNPFFRANESSNDETAVGKFFDLLSQLPVNLRVFVRHNRKPGEKDSYSDDSLKIRGSGQFSDVPDALFCMHRTDKRLAKAEMTITKFRHGFKPEPLEVWFDAARLCLVPYSPVVYLLKDGPLPRPALLMALKDRFNVSQDYADKQLLKPLRDADYVSDGMRDGHSKVFELDWERIEEADWYQRFVNDNPQFRRVGDRETHIM
jgi:hypothetical protein